MNKKLKNTGITLISLVITIIIMLILVGVSITLAVNGGLFEYAGNAVGDTKNSIKNEQGLIDEIINDYIKPNTMKSYADTETDETTGMLKANAKYESDGLIAVIPEGFKVSEEEGETSIKDGLVIIDKDGNEFVWVPCTTDETNTSVTQYAQDKRYNNGTLASKEYYYTTYTDWTDNGGNAKSVEKYGGFYVARYEAGLPSEANLSGTTNGAKYTYNGRDTTDYVPVSKKNNPSWNGISQKNAVTVSANMYKDSSSVESSLIDSYAWDTIVNWMESKEEYKGIATDSTNYGNYVDSKMTLTDVLYAEHQLQYSPWTWTRANKYKKGELSITPRDTTGTQTVYEIATGSTEKTKVLNIYDMAGNMWEWTTETGYHNAGTSGTQYAVVRGGGFDHSGHNDTVAYRNGSSFYEWCSLLYRVPCSILHKVAQKNINTLALVPFKRGFFTDFVEIFSFTKLEKYGITELIKIFINSVFF